MHGTHWLVTVAQRAGLRVADRTEYSTTDLESVWSGVCEDTEASPADLASAVARHFRLETADFARLDPAVTRLVPSEVVRKFSVMPLGESYHTLVVATADPTNLDAEQAIAFASGRSIRFAVAPPEPLADIIDEYYPAERGSAEALRAAEADVPDIQVVTETDDVVLDVSDVESEPVIKLTNLIFKEAIEADASDIHIEPEDGGGTVRIRVDGVLRKHMELPRQAMIRVVSRIKVLGDLDIADHIRPQDGRSRIRIGSRAYDLRISTVPARDAEKVVIRILDPGKTTGGLEDLFIPEPELGRLRRVTRNPDGIVVVTGPTGSGKTTTLYSLLQELSTDRVNIMTVEDPVEYRLPGITQIQVEKKRGVTFASTLRAILRQDPDIIFVGEIRDLETAEIAVQASMTGHLVLATLHTNDAAAAVQRLIDLGLDGPSIAGSLRASLAQRLVRTTCVECAGAGCDECGHTGYSGRRPVVELMVLDDETTARVAREAAYPEIREAALASGMRPLSQVGYELIRDGVSTKEEVERVLGEVAAPADDAGPTQPAQPLVEPNVMTSFDPTLPDGGKPAFGDDGMGHTTSESGGDAAVEPHLRRLEDLAPAPLPPNSPPAYGGLPAEPAHPGYAPPAERPAARYAPISDARSGFPTLPTATGAAEPSQPFQTPGSPPTAVPTDGTQPTQRTRVLVVDDDPVSRTLARSLLESDGIVVTEAGDGMGAIQALAAGMEFDLCVLDLNMPNVDGREVLQKIREAPETRTLPVIVLTGNNDGEAEIELMQAGADDYIRKPLDAGRFMVRVKATLRRAGHGSVFGGAA